jgi:hypothetical protein
MLHRALAVAFCAVPMAAQQWQAIDGPYFAGRGMVWDSARHRAVAFGSEGETWEYDGNTRLHRSTPTAPPGRSYHAMVYDAARGQTLLFGGSVNTVPVGDCWLWDGCTWQHPAFAVLPPPRSSAAIAFDSWRNRVVMFGGYTTNSQPLSDTWEYDGTQWIQRTPATVPSTSFRAQATFDSARGVTVLITQDGTGYASMFEWNGTNWRFSPAGAPPQGGDFNFSLGFDPVRQRIVLFQGNPYGVGNQLWVGNGNTWQLGASGVITTDTPAMYFDQQRGAMVITGGSTSSLSPAVAWTPTAAWTWDGTTLAALWPDSSPTKRYGFACFQDDVRNRAVLFGGLGTTLLNDTWEWDGQQWTQRTQGASPSPRKGAATCFDPTSGTGLLFGGEDNQGPYLADSWRWNGNTWASVSGAGPTGRARASMAWDSVRNEAILFGGGQSITPMFNDTWRWNGAGWSNTNASVAPSPRTGAALACDPIRARMVLFGGAFYGTSTWLHDTWEWDGVHWQQVGTPQSPPILYYPAMVHDSVRGRMVLAGLDSTQYPLVLQTWQYDGTNWTFVCSFPGRGDIYDVRLVWDRQRLRPVLFDGNTVRELTSLPAAADVLGSGCGAPPPLLTARTRPRTGESQFGLELFTRPNLPVAFSFGFVPGNTPIGNGCTVLLQQIDTSTFVPSGPNGTALLAVPLPANQSLRGLVVYAQAGVRDPYAPGGSAFSQSLRLTVGD